ncbi:MAG: arginine beta-hydroxylase, Fe(II)/alpha-ketoglutarate-dependent [Pseudonocardiales bacterium]|nr:arginine beta-hydroxylase, Fe(II)/alpha-ketoglutarate-dependent [Pseudonocardiales bacterium]
MNNLSSERLELGPDEALATAQLAEELTNRYSSSEDPQFIEDLPLWASELPTRTRRFLRRFQTQEPSGFCVVSGHVIEQDRIGPTPEDWRGRALPRPEFPEEVILLLYASLVGEPFGWTTQQDGVLVHDVFPMRKHETDQLGMNSKELLTWHTEDAFHPYRADFLILASLRNPGNVATTVGSFNLDLLTSKQIDILFQERFIIRPDESHLPKNNTKNDQNTFANILQINNAAKPVAILFGSPTDPYLRIDPYFMEIPDGNKENKDAYKAIIALIEVSQRDVVLSPGDYLILNNHRVVHGRRPFKARYDGTDRWLKRINVTRDLAKSRSMRASNYSRLIG